MPGRHALSAHGAGKLIVKTDRQTETEKDTYAKLCNWRTHHLAQILNFSVGEDLEFINGVDSMFIYNGPCSH
jgi:16S rRNA U1498 N3-methylase RsmE